MAKDKKVSNNMAVLRSIREDLSDPNISQAEKKDLEQKKKDFLKQEKIVVEDVDYILGDRRTAKDGKKTDFGMLSVKKGIDKNPKPTQADRIAGATMKDGSRTKVRGVRIANKGFRKAKLS